MVNTGVRAYQLYTFLGLVQRYFGTNIRRQVYEYQLEVLDGVSGVGQKYAQAIELIMLALSTKVVTIPTDSGETEVPMEMNVDWRFSELLAHSREEVTVAFAPMLAYECRQQHGTHSQAC